MPGYLKALGYSTHMFGKWNIGHCNSKYLPHERGFDHFLGYLCPGHGYSVSSLLAPLKRKEKNIGGKCAK